MTQSFDPRTHVRFRFSDLPKDGWRHAAFKDWIENMDFKLDGEYGEDWKNEKDETVAGFWTWINQHDQDPEFRGNELFGTFIWFHAITGVPVATGTIAPDDRETKKNHNLPGDGFWGGVNIHRDLRERGLGRRVVGELDDHVALFAQQKPLLFHLFTENPIAAQMYLKRGYKPNPLGFITTEAFGDERLYTKQYGG